LESTSIQFIQSGVSKIFDFFPTRDFDARGIREYNRLSALELEQVRDFIILHYHMSRGDDSPFWSYCRGMPIPDMLKHKIALYRAGGHLVTVENEPFAEPSWLAMFTGLGLEAARYDPLADERGLDEVRGELRERRARLRRAAEAMASHRDFIARHCGAAARAV
jgi:tryptophan halogenase